MKNIDLVNRNESAIETADEAESFASMSTMSAVVKGINALIYSLCKMLPVHNFI